MIRNERAILAWDKAVRGEHGGNRNPTGRNQHTPEPEAVPDVVKLDNIQLDHGAASKPSSDYGTSAQAGLRRLEKAASAGDGNAADLLRRVVDPSEKGATRRSPLSHLLSCEAVWCEP